MGDTGPTWTGGADLLHATGSCWDYTAGPAGVSSPTPCSGELGNLGPRLRPTAPPPAPNELR